MYDELVKRLRYCSEEQSGCGLCALSSDCVLRVGLLTEAADAIEGLERQVFDMSSLIGDYSEKSRWIPVTERLPRGGENVLAYYHNPYNQFIVCATWDSKRQEWIPDLESIDGYYITAWMPLPEPPKEEA